MMARVDRKAESAISCYETERVGERLREMRLGRKLTISRLSELSGVPSSTVSKIENGQMRPSLVHAINLAAALRENLGFLIARYRGRPQPRVIVRRAKRETIDYPDMGLTLQDLSGHFLPGILEARIGVLERGAHSGVGSMTHPGEEFCYVISGAISYCVDDETFDLAAGEYLQFKSSVRHSWENAHTGTTQVLWVFSDGLSF